MITISFVKTADMPGEQRPFYDRPAVRWLNARQRAGSDAI
jgi:hypothetical protein